MPPALLMASLCQRKTTEMTGGRSHAFFPPTVCFTHLLLPCGQCQWQNARGDWRPSPQDPARQQLAALELPTPSRKHGWPRVTLFAGERNRRASTSSDYLILFDSPRFCFKICPRLFIQVGPPPWVNSSLDIIAMPCQFFNSKFYSLMVATLLYCYSVNCLFSKKFTSFV